MARVSRAHALVFLGEDYTRVYEYMVNRTPFRILAYELHQQYGDKRNQREKLLSSVRSNPHGGT